MLLAKIVDGEVAAYPYSREALVADYAAANEGAELTLPLDLTGVDLTEFGAAVVASAERPEPSEAGKIVEEVTPELDVDVWRQSWAERDMTPEELAALVPVAVSMRQARLALLASGKLGDVETALEGLPSPAREAARIEWEYATEVRRDSPLVTSLAPALALDNAALDALFVLAAGL